MSCYHMLVKSNLGFARRMNMSEAWRGFRGSHWMTDVNVRDFIQNNYNP